ncbi:TIGR01777 family oxidoreductase [Paraferrimonas sp. SM1919]|uniref:TIGR01777 family oxidoreductase n=1 Tax=Paraferrimonas sp. SM1919 TaxID=2662263 RepID=UPI0013D722D5|nr:TIGR01777 family oxidoreductase [Paraferrimonas sp. SM1919]
MQILITGGTGLIGQALIAALPEYHFTILTRQSRTDTPSITHIHTLDNLKNLNQFDVVINLAGEGIAAKRWNVKRRLELKQSRHGISQQLVNLVASSTKPPQRIINASAVGIYGTHHIHHLNEQSPYGIDFPSRLCKEWEEINNQATSKVTQVLNLRFGVVLAKHGGMLAKLYPTFSRGLGSILGNGKQGISWIHIDDLVELIKFCIDHPTLTGSINACAPNPVSQKEFAVALAAQLQKPLWLSIPALPLKLVLGEMSTLVLDGQMVYPHKALEAGFVFEYPDLASALAQIYPTN